MSPFYGFKLSKRVRDKQTLTEARLRFFFFFFLETRLLELVLTLAKEEIDISNGDLDIEIPCARDMTTLLNRTPSQKC